MHQSKRLITPCIFDVVFWHYKLHKPEFKLSSICEQAPCSSKETRSSQNLGEWLHIKIGFQWVGFLSVLYIYCFETLSYDQCQLKKILRDHIILWGPEPGCYIQEENKCFFQSKDSFLSNNLAYLVREEHKKISRPRVEQNSGIHEPIWGHSYSGPKLSLKICRRSKGNRYPKSLGYTNHSASWDNALRHMECIVQFD